MNVITVRLPTDLHQALREASLQRGVSMSAMVREALDSSLRDEGMAVSAAERWIEQWRGKLRFTDTRSGGDAVRRLNHLLAKHVC